MKKFMILLLSLAVLFSFAACDNSSNTPADPDEPTTGVVDMQIEDLAKDVAGYIVDSSNGISALLGTSSLINTDGSALAPASGKTVTVSDDYETITITKTLDDGVGTTVPDTVITLVLNGTAVASKTVANTSMEIALETYSYSVSTSVMGTDYNYQPATATVNGYLVGTVAVTLTTGSQAVTPTAPSDILIPETSEGVSATIGNVAVDAGKFYDFLTNEALSGMTAYATYRSTEIAAYETEIKSFITALTASGSDLITDLATVGSNGLTGTYSASGAGSAVITYSNESDDDIKLAGSSSTYVYLPAGGSMTLNLAGASGSTATADSFTVATYTLSGTFALYSDEGTTANKNFAEMTVTGLSGAATGTVNASSNNVVTGVASFGFTDQTAGTASAQVGVGPTLAADGTNTLETVTATYTAD